MNRIRPEHNEAYTQMVLTYATLVPEPPGDYEMTPEFRRERMAGMLQGFLLASGYDPVDPQVVAQLGEDIDHCRRTVREMRLGGTSDGD